MGDATDPRPPADGQEGDVFAVRARVTQEQARELARTGEFDYGDRLHWSPNPDGTGRLDLLVSQAQIDELRGRGIEVEVESNESAKAREVLRDVGEGDRFEGGRVPPGGIGRKIGGQPGRREERPR
jgi:hypothetical protein